MSMKAMIFGTDGIYPKLKPFYEAEIKRGNLEIVSVVADTSKLGGYNFDELDIAIISSRGYFYERMKQLETLGFSHDKIIDGRVFRIPLLDLPRLLKEGVAYGVLENLVIKAWAQTIYPQRYTVVNSKTTLSIGVKSYLNGVNISGGGIATVGNYSSISWGISFKMGRNADHNYRNVGSFGLNVFDWRPVPVEYFSPRGICKILIGSDVWIGENCILKCNNPNKPLVIGDGAVIAADSVVVKNVPPYAIVGGNPAKIIKYRFEPHIIEALLRIKWWDWSLDKIHDNFKYFNDIERFIELHDK